MANGVQINSLLIPGFVTNVDFGAAKLMTARTHRWGTRGVSEIRSLAGDSPIIVTITIFKGSAGAGGYASYAELEKLLNLLRQRTGEHGTLTITTPSKTERHEDCTFEGFTRGDRGPLPDIGNGLGGGANAWHIDGVLRFTKLIP